MVRHDIAQEKCVMGNADYMLMLVLAERSNGKSEALRVGNCTGAFIDGEFGQHKR